ncbi:guanine nucleotide-binding protein-like 3 [Rhinophrynus dorsalis]
MKRPKLRKSSKRVSCHKRYKIQKKVREHKRKVRKESKKSVRGKQKRDLRVPNDAPFKQEILREAELRKQRREELKKAQKLERQKETAKKRQLEKNENTSEKKVREHKRKVRKESKKSVRGKQKRDLRVPNDAPFKQEILREAELRKQRREELKKAQKLERQKETAKKRQLEKNVEKNENTSEKKDKKPSTDSKPRNPRDEHSERSFCREVNKVIEASDVVLEVLDARDPLGSRCVQAETAVLRNPSKKLLLVLNKIDLVPKENLEKWLQVLNLELPTIAFKSSTQVQDRNLKQEQTSRMRPGCIDVTRGAMCLGGDTLLRLLNALQPAQDQAVKVGLIGFANVGKSSLINSLRQIRTCNVGAIKGTTRIMQEVNLNPQIKLLDSPALVVSSNNLPLAVTLRSTFHSKEDDVLKTVGTILKHSNKQQVMLQYNISDFRNPLEFITLLANKRGMLKKGGVADTESAARLLLNDWMGARLSYHSQPTGTPSSQAHISEERAASVWEGIDLKVLEEENRSTLKALKCPSSASSIAFKSMGLTNGILNESEIIDLPPEEDEMESEEEADIGEEEEEEEASEEEDEATGQNEDEETKMDAGTIGFRVSFKEAGFFPSQTPQGAEKRHFVHGAIQTLLDKEVLEPVPVLEMAPQVFCRVLGALVSIIPRDGIRVTPCMDDLLLKAFLLELLHQQVKDCILALTHHRWIVNMDKSDFVPSQRLFLGLLFDTKQGMVFLMDEVAHQNVHKVCSVLAYNPILAKKLASLVGKFISTIEAVPFEMVHTRELQRYVL